MLLIIIYLSFKILIIEKSESGNLQNPSSPSDVCFLGVTNTVQNGKNYEFGIWPFCSLVLKHLANCLLSSDLNLSLSICVKEAIPAYQGVVLVKLVDKNSVL